MKAQHTSNLKQAKIYTTRFIYINLLFTCEKLNLQHSFVLNCGLGHHGFAPNLITADNRSRAFSPTSDGLEATFHIKKSEISHAFVNKRKKSLPVT